MNYLRFSLCLLLPFFLQAQVTKKQFAFGSLTIKDGLSQNSVISMEQDSIGYLWFATQDGLNKYDGKNFIVYNKQFQDITRPTFSKLGKVLIDKQNKLWIVNNSGFLEYLESSTNTFKTIKNIQNVSTIYQDKLLNYYVGTYNNGLFKIDAKTKDTLQIFRKDQQNKTVYDFLEHHDSIYIACDEAVFVVSKKNTYKEVKIFDKISTNFSCFEQSKNGTIWLGSYGKGLFFKPSNRNFFKPFVLKNLPNNLNIEDLLVDSNNKLWIATYGNGVYLYDPKTKSVINFMANKDNPFDLHYNDVLTLFEDNTGVIWFGTDGAGISYYDEHLIKFNILTNNQLPKNVSVDVVRSITSNNADNVWIGTSGKGLTFLDLSNNYYKTYTTENTSGLNSNRIVSLNYINNSIWIGHQGFGLNILENGTYKNFYKISNFTIWRIIKVNSTSAWLCTERNGLILFDKQKGIIKQFNTSNSQLSSNNIRAMVEGPNNILWVGTESNGLFKLNSITGESKKIDLVQEPIKSLLYSDNILWIGTYGKGLIKYNLNTNKIKSYTINDGLPNNVIYGILKDNKDNLWLSSNLGISKFSVKKNLKPEIENYTDADGLQNLEFNTGAYYQDKNGVIYFGGLDGINWFNPNQLTFNNTKPKTVISEFEVYSKPHTLDKNLKLHFNENTVTFTFSSLHFSAPERNQFKYQLVNHDSTWVDAGNRKVAHYTNLPPNDYEFKVISSNYDGIWNTTPATYSFTVLKPWYLTNTLKAIYIISFLLLVFGVYKYLSFRLKVKTQLQLKQAEAERLKKIDEFKTKLYTNISHEIRTPLTLISGPIENQLNKKNISKADKKELSIVKQNANRLISLVNQMLDLSMVDSGQKKLKVANGNLGILLKQIFEAFQYQAREKDIQLKCSIKKLNKAWFDKDIIEKVVSNLISNAIKYAPKHSKIVINAFNNNEMLVFSIVNQTNEATLKNLNKLFKRFYQDNEASDGVGVGLALVAELVSLSKGHIVANNIENKALQFTITLPIEKAAFTTSELENTKDSFKNKRKIKQPVNNNAPTLLVVEDNKEISDYLTTLFSDSYKVFTAVNGQKGINIALKIMPELIVSDIMMPIKNGIELCKEIKTNVLTSHIPIVLLTAKTTEEHEIEGYKTGADAYITKPFSNEKLKLIVHKLIETRKKLEKHYSKTFDINPNLAITSTENEFLTRLKTVVETHITDSLFTSEQFGKLMQMSRTQLHRKLHAIVGMSTSEFIRSQRLKLAKELLTQSDANVSEIAYQVGFNSSSYFIKCFKGLYNCTPSEYLLK